MDIYSKYSGDNTHLETSMISILFYPHLPGFAGLLVKHTQRVLPEPGEGWGGGHWPDSIKT